MHKSLSTIVIFTVACFIFMENTEAAERIQAKTISHPSAADCGCESEASCDDGCCERCRLFRRRRPRMDGLNLDFNCGCNGSYKFPVPPLYTYHWPGMYSHQLMTDYHSPWRFPPLKPYSDEQLPPKGGDNRGAQSLKDSSIRPVSAEVEEARPGRAMSMSQLMRQLYR